MSQSGQEHQDTAPGDPGSSGPAVSPSEPQIPEADRTSASDRGSQSPHASLHAVDPSPPHSTTSSAGQNPQPPGSHVSTSTLDVENSAGGTVLPPSEPPPQDTIPQTTADAAPSMPSSPPTQGPTGAPAASAAQFSLTSFTPVVSASDPASAAPSAPNSTAQLPIPPNPNIPFMHSPRSVGITRREPSEAQSTTSFESDFNVRYEQQQANREREASALNITPSISSTPSTFIPPPNDVVGKLPKYAMPNISSMLPSYANSEGEFIFRAFNTGNYDQLRHLPATLQEQQVTAARATRMELAKQFLMPAMEGPMLKSKADGIQGLFSTFEYIHSRYSLADELAAKERVAAETVRLTVGRGKEFVPIRTINLPKHKEQDNSKPYPTLGGPFEALDELQHVYKMAEAAKLGPKPFLTSDAQKMISRPTKALTQDMLDNIRKWILQDWEGAEVSVFENEQDCWVIRIQQDSVDSMKGLLAYMNVFVRANALVTEYGLTKVVEFWDSQPGDGCAYYVVRPPWVKVDPLQTFFSLHPEERDWRSSYAIGVLHKEREALKKQVFQDGLPVAP